jgi:hypothetical protein
MVTHKKAIPTEAQWLETCQLLQLISRKHRVLALLISKHNLLKTQMDIRLVWAIDRQTLEEIANRDPTVVLTMARPQLHNIRGKILKDLLRIQIAR